MRRWQHSAGGGEEEVYFVKERADKRTPNGHQWLSPHPTTHETGQMNTRAAPCNNPSWEANIPHSWETPSLLRNRKFLYPFHKSWPLFHIVCHINAKAHFHTSADSLPLKFSHYISVAVSISHICVIYTTHLLPINALTQTIHCEYCQITIV